MIKTDAISISILFIKLNCKKPLKSQNNGKENIEYIENVEMTEEIKSKKVVCIDPNYADLIYCGSRDNNGKLITFRYTQNQRRKETGKKKYMKIRENENKKVKIDDKTIKEIETELSHYNSKTNNYKKLKEYVTIKNKINKELFTFYEQQYHRKFKLNIQRSESKMINNFKNKFGTNKEVIIVMGDYDKKEHMRNLEPVICKKFRKIFKNARYVVHLINEFRTSKLCNKCHKELEPFSERESHKPKSVKEHKLITVHGLLRHTDVKHKCDIIHNRDKNAVQNMLNIVEEIKKTGKRSIEYCRKEI